MYLFLYLPIWISDQNKLRYKTYNSKLIIKNKWNICLIINNIQPQTKTYLLSTNTISGDTKFLLRYVFQLSVHTIWLERNGRRHGTVNRFPSLLIKFIDKQVRNRISSLRGRGGTTFNKTMVVWFSTRD